MRTLMMGLITTAGLMVAASVQAEIKIAIVGPLTGQYASFGEQMKAGTEAAVRDINSDGGIMGEKIALSIGDDACDPKQAVAVANQMVGEGIKFVAGHFCSGSSIPASQVYNESNILQISPASTNPQLTENGRANVFRVCGRDDQQGLVAAQYLHDKYSNKNIAIVHDRTAYGKGLADATRQSLNDLGTVEAMYEAYQAGESDYSALVTKLKEGNIDALYVGGYHTEAGLMIRQMREQGMNTQLISGDALVTDEYWQITGDSGEGTMMTFAPDPRKMASAAKTVANFKAQGIEPEGYTLFSYAAVQVYKQAVEAAGSTDLNKLIAEIRSGKFDTVIGELSFDDKGDIEQPAYVWYRWSKGTYAEIN